MAQLGYCPNCGRDVDMDGVSCQACGANFGPGSNWKPLTSKPLVQSKSTFALATSLVVKAITASALALTAGLMGLLALMAAIHSEIETVLHLSLVALMLGYVVAMLIAGFLAYLIFKSAIDDYRARKRLVPSEGAFK